MSKLYFFLLFSILTFNTSIIAQDGSCDTPSQITFDDYTDSSFDLSWNEIEGVLGYFFQFYINDEIFFETVTEQNFIHIDISTEIGSFIRVDVMSICNDGIPVPSSLPPINHLIVGTVDIVLLLNGKPDCSSCSTGYKRCSPPVSGDPFSNGIYGTWVECPCPCSSILNPFSSCKSALPQNLNACSNPVRNLKTPTPSSQLAANFHIAPNPIKNNSTLHIDIDQEQAISIIIYDQMGRKVLTLIDHELMPEGHHEIPFNSHSISKGFYYCTLIANGNKEVIKFIK